MSSWLDHKYVNLLSSRLERFKRKGSNLYNFRCPICNDSEKNKIRARGYIYEKGGVFHFHCHNCNASHLFRTFLKIVDPFIYDEYVLEKLKDERSSSQLDELVDIPSPIPIFADLGPVKKLQKISSLDESHPVREFVEKRKIPDRYFSKLFACPNFMHFTNQIVPNKFSEQALMHDETRLLIPFLNQKKELHGFQGRVLHSLKNKVKYLTIVTDTKTPHVYGLDEVDFKKTTWVFEGPIDSMFISNSIATLGGDLVSAVRDLPTATLVIVYDNERRSKDTKKKIDKAINLGYSVCIWPDYLDGLKDVNDMVLSGCIPEQLEQTMMANTFSGLSAKMRLTQWARA